MNYNISSIDGLKSFISSHLELFKSKKILLFGELGAGKTTFVKILGELLGFKNISSPTFTIMNRYFNGDDIFIHLDLYRLTSLNELENIGFFDYIDTNYTIAVEWADRFNLKDMLDEYTLVELKKIDNDDRVVKINLKGE
ncbi:MULTISPECIES: tRNA (adenosine(37)-N6)-threonylcarbamoyltransferase complex ATPase subunit type 1 TsaE [Calditerrivibrio]|jgi:tRNA threonylcarbamoyladenosine biosynthesis protein TsaE|uniref:tRNA threonylcarbamoyladenosine biosynthesis protein TsaE n=1 Tax=Calditerrivibrio nitroreducens TaxID=477976 RepID=A0A2J6WPS6_9BACT|nr:MAG: tRNA (adenosine(37)-N6)-threonylcarbamoyltransferase complex ATPase subunit type 1 TsaE [Calditerrivibrio nitroreducens]